MNLEVSADTRVNEPGFDGSYNNYIQNFPFPTIWLDKVPRTAYIGNQPYNQLAVDFTPMDSLPSNVTIYTLIMFDTAFTLNYEGGFISSVSPPIEVGQLQSFISSRIERNQGT